MKKLLSLMGSFTLTATATATVVACGSVTPDDSEEDIPVDEETNNDLYQKQEERLQNDVQEIMSKSISVASQNGALRPRIAVQSSKAFLNSKNSFFTNLKNGEKVESIPTDMLNNIENDVNSIFEGQEAIAKINSKSKNPQGYGLITPRDGNRDFFRGNGANQNLFLVSKTAGKDFVENVVIASDANEPAFFTINFTLEINSGDAGFPFVISESNGEGVKHLFTRDTRPKMNISMILATADHIIQTIEDAQRAITDVFREDLKNETFSPLLMEIDIDKTSSTDQKHAFNLDSLSAGFSIDTYQEKNQKPSVQSKTQELLKDTNNLTIIKNILKPLESAGVNQLESDDIEFNALNSGSSINQYNEMSKERNDGDSRGNLVNYKKIVADEKQLPTSGNERYLYNWFSLDDGAIPDDVNRWKKLQQDLEDDKLDVDQSFGYNKDSKLNISKQYEVWNNSVDTFVRENQGILTASGLMEQLSFIKENAYHFGTYELSGMFVKSGSLAGLKLPTMQIPYVVFATSKSAGSGNNITQLGLKNVVKRTDLISIMLDEYFVSYKEWMGIVKNTDPTKSIFMINDTRGKEFINQVTNAQINQASAIYPGTGKTSFLNKFKFPTEVGSKWRGRNLWYIGEGDNPYYHVPMSGDNSPEANRMRNISNYAYYANIRVKTEYVTFLTYEISSDYGWSYSLNGSWDPLVWGGDSLRLAQKIIGDFNLNYVNLFFTNGKPVKEKVSNYGDGVVPSDITENSFLFLFDSKKNEIKF